jgi:Helix-turn-helix domain
LVVSSRAVRRPLTRTDPPATPTANLHDLPVLLTVAETAEVLRVGRSWVYEHAAELGAVKLGCGQSAPLRIPRDGVERMLGAPPPQRDRRWVPAARACKVTTSKGELQPRPRL